MSASVSGGAKQPSGLSEELASSRLCADLSPDRLLALSRLARRKSYAALEEAVIEGQPVSEVEIVTSGRFVVLLPSAQIDLHASGSFSLHLYVTGDCFGLSGLVDRACAPASVIASEVSTAIAIPVDALRRFLETDHASAAIVYRNLFAIQTRRLDSLTAQ